MNARIVAVMLMGAALLAGCSGTGAGSASDEPSSVGATTLNEVAPSTDAEQPKCAPTTNRNVVLRADLVGRQLSEVKDREITAGHKIRILGEDGVCAGGTDDQNSNRVNIVLENGTIVWAGMY